MKPTTINNCPPGTRYADLRVANGNKQAHGRLPPLSFAAATWNLSMA